jgi:hypothetical protein
MATGHLVPGHSGFDRLKWRNIGGVDEQLDAARLTRGAANEAAPLKLKNHAVNTRWCDLEEGLKVGLSGRATVE